MWLEIATTLLLATALSSQASAGGCNSTDGWTSVPSPGGCIRLESSAAPLMLDWFGAAAHCHALGGGLVTTDTPARARDVAAHVGASGFSGRVWTAGNDLADRATRYWGFPGTDRPVGAGALVMADNSQHHCLYLDTGYVDWIYDEDCFREMAVVCEKSVNEDEDGIYISDDTEEEVMDVTGSFDDYAEREAGLGWGLLWDLEEGSGLELNWDLEEEG